MGDWRGPLVNQPGQAWLGGWGGAGATARVPRSRLRTSASKAGAPSLSL